MRTVAAVLVFVACVQAALWAFTRTDLSAPPVENQLASVSYAPFDASANPGRRRQDDRRAHPRRHEGVRADHARGPALFLDRRRRVGAAHCFRIRLARHGRRLDRQGPEAQRARDRFGDRPCPPQQQRQKRHRRQRNNLPPRPERPRPHQDDPARQALDQRAGVDRRNLARLDRPSRAGLAGRLHRRAHPALLGRLLRHAGGRSGDDRLRQTAPSLSRQTHRNRRIRLAERGLQSEECGARPRRAGARLAQLHLARRGLRHPVQHRRGPRPAVEDFRRQRRPLLGSVRRVPSCQVRLGRPDHQSRSLAARRHRDPVEHPVVAADPGDPRRHRAAGRADGGRRQCGRRLGRRLVRLLARPLFRPRRAVRARARHAAADPAHHHRARARRGGRGCRFRRAPTTADRAFAGAGAGAGSCT